MTTTAAQMTTSASLITTSAIVSSLNRSVNAVRIRSKSQSAGDGTPWNGAAPPKRARATSNSTSGMPTAMTASSTMARRNASAFDPPLRIIVGLPRS